MPINFKQRAADLAAQIADVDVALGQPQEDARRRRLVAERASLLRSLRWYQARTGTRSDIHALSAHVSDEITTAEAGV